MHGLGQSHLVVSQPDEGLDEHVGVQQQQRCMQPAALLLPAASSSRQPCCCQALMRYLPMHRHCKSPSKHLEACVHCVLMRGRCTL